MRGFLLCNEKCVFVRMLKLSTRQQSSCEREHHHVFSHPCKGKSNLIDNLTDYLACNCINVQKMYFMYTNL